MALLYDKLMDANDYVRWSEFILNIIKADTPIKGVDLACGTGEITLRLKKAGIDMTGIDLSVEMLDIAMEKARKQGLVMPFMCSDIKDFELHDKVDLITCVCDGVNYLTGDNDINLMFACCKKWLNPNGVLIFDISSEYKLMHILGDNILTSSNDDISYIWENEYNIKKKLCSMDLSFFVKQDDDSYTRFYEFHEQRAYTVDEISEALLNAGFLDIKTCCDYSSSAIHDKCNRITFTVRA